MAYSGIDICRLSELIDWEPDLAQKIEKEKVVFDGGNVYKLTKKGWVYRQPLYLWKVSPFKKPLVEKYEKPKGIRYWPPSQTKLLEVES